MDDAALDGLMSVQNRVLLSGRLAYAAGTAAILHVSRVTREYTNPWVEVVDVVPLYVYPAGLGLLKDKVGQHLGLEVRIESTETETRLVFEQVLCTFTLTKDR